MSNNKPSGENQVEQLYVVGIFRDIMVEATLIDAISSGFKTVNLIYDEKEKYI